MQLLEGNSNTYILKATDLLPPVTSSRVRFVPYSELPRTVCMRVEIYGCRRRGELFYTFCFNNVLTIYLFIYLSNLKRCSIISKLKNILPNLIFVSLPPLSFSPHSPLIFIYGIFFEFLRIAIKCFLFQQ